MVAAEGATSALLKEEFADVKFLPLMGYRVKYSRRKIFLPWKMLSQFPKMIFTIYKEQQWLQQAIIKYDIDAVISDNRFGMYNNKVPCIYITHQLLIKTGNRITEKIAQQIHYHFIKKYKECWVPDFKEEGLAGELSHPKNIPVNTKYIGCLSRFEKADVEIKYDLLISISGPEPQRTIFEQQLFGDLKNFKGKVLFVRGLPHADNQLSSGNINIEIKNHLSGKDLNNAMLQSEMVISRCGYTTVMDLVKLNKKAILIPTPGQTEQEYLAKYLRERKIFFTINQNAFSLNKNLLQAQDFPFDFPQHNMNEYKNTTTQFVQSLQTRNFASQ